MTMPPRTPELLLETLGAEPHLRDAIIGDLAEEYRWIADTVDERSARRWYWRQAPRAVPILVRSSLRAATIADVRRRLGITASAGAFMVLLMVCGALVVRALLPAVNSAPDGLDVVSMALVVSVLGVLTPLAGGYVAAWLDDRAPFASAASFAITWVALITTIRLSMIGSLGVFGVVGAIGVMGLITFGGILRLRQLARYGKASHGGTATA